LGLFLDILRRLRGCCLCIILSIFRDLRLAPICSSFSILRIRLKNSFLKNKENFFPNSECFRLNKRLERIDLRGNKLLFSWPVVFKLIELQFYFVFLVNLQELSLRVIKEKSMFQAQRRELLKGETLGITVNNVSFLLEHLADLRERKFLRFNMSVQS